MADTRKPLFDRRALALHRKRATDHGLFLHDVALDLIEERLIEVNKTFSKTAVISWQAQKWADRLSPEADIFTAKDHLGLDDRSQYDLAIHGMELHHMDDPVGQLIQMRRAMVPDGLMIACLFGARTLPDFREALTQAEINVTGGLSPRMAPLADLRDLGALLQRAGFALPVADSHLQKVTYSTLSDLLRDLRMMAETNIMVDRPKTTTRKGLFTELERLLFNGASRTVEFELVFLTGWVPSESQQKPLKPGSATHSLAEALTKQRDSDPT